VLLVLKKAKNIHFCSQKSAKHDKKEINIKNHGIKVPYFN